MRSLLWFAVGVHLVTLVAAVATFVDTGSGIAGAVAGWCIWFGALTLRHLRTPRGVRA